MSGDREAEGRDMEADGFYASMDQLYFVLIAVCRGSLPARRKIKGWWKGGTREENTNTNG